MTSKSLDNLIKWRFQVEETKQQIHVFEVHGAREIEYQLFPFDNVSPLVREGWSNRLSPRVCTRIHVVCVPSRSPCSLSRDVLHKGSNQQDHCRAAHVVETELDTREAAQF